MLEDKIRLRKEIEIQVDTAQKFLNYKRGDITFDAFVKDAMELIKSSSLCNDTIEPYYRNFLEGLQSNTLPNSSSGSSFNAIMDYEGLFNAVVDLDDGTPVGPDDRFTEGEVEELWNLGMVYSRELERKLKF
jgi:hypothetical protein